MGLGQLYAILALGPNGMAALAGKNHSHIAKGSAECRGNRHAGRQVCLCPGRHVGTAISRHAFAAPAKSAWGNVFPIPLTPLRGCRVWEFPRCRTDVESNKKNGIPRVFSMRQDALRVPLCSTLFRFPVPYLLLVKQQLTFNSVPLCSAAYLYCLAPPLLLLLFVGINSLVLSGVTGSSWSGLLTRLSFRTGIRQPYLMRQQRVYRMSLASSLPSFVRIQPSRRERSASL